VAYRMDNTRPPLVSFIIPVYNEEHNITTVLHHLHEVTRLHPDWRSEVLVIEDGSKDNTRNVLLEEIKKYPKVKILLHDKNMGYTHSLKDGIKNSHGLYLMYIGADEEFDCSEIPNFINLFLVPNSEKVDVILGVRWQRNAYKLFRFFLSVIYIFLLNFLFKLRINDYNWSQAWRREIIEKIQLNSKSLFVLPEIIIKAHDLKAHIKEIPSNHRGRQAGKSSVNLSIMGHALIEAIQFWRYRLSKKYDPKG
jgi:dolichol-phosphate mannosyltransferase